jgi:hypothetical protein
MKPAMPVFLIVRPAWAQSWRCKSFRELTTANEMKRNCMRATERGESEARCQACTHCRNFQLHILIVCVRNKIDCLGYVSAQTEGNIKFIL